MIHYRFIAANYRCEGDFLEQLPEDGTDANPNPEQGLCELSVMGKNQHATIEFVLDHRQMNDPELLAERYQGAGIYLKNHYREDWETIPLWIVIRSQEFTRSRVQKILSFVAQILESDDYKNKKYWEIG